MGKSPGAVSVYMNRVGLTRQGRWRRITPQEMDFIALEWKKGTSIKAIALLVGRYQDQVWRLAVYKMGLTRRRAQR